MKRILVVGDSWAAGHVAETQTDEGWPVMAGVPDYLRQGVDGSTAVDWANDKNGMLTRALGTPCDAVVVSLGGNDVMYAGSKMTPALVAGIVRALSTVVNRLAEAHPQVWLMTYANPYPDRPDVGLAVMAMNFGIRLSGGSAKAKIFDTAKLLTEAGDFAAADFHPSLAGHRKLADAIVKEIGQ